MQQAFLFFDRFNGAGEAVVSLQAIPHFESDPRTGAEGILATLVRGRKQNGYSSAPCAQDHAKSQLAELLTQR